MMQNRRELPGRIVFTLGVAMSSTCVALILILWVVGRHKDDLFADAACQPVDRCHAPRHPYGNRAPTVGQANPSWLPGGW
jgi:hypothetical protein